MNTPILEKEIKKFQEKIAKIDAEIGRLSAEKKILEHHTSGLVSAMNLLGFGKSATVKQDLREGSEVSAVRNIIRAAGKPIHINEIIRKLGKEVRDKRVSLSGSLNAYVRKGDVFVKTGPNIFGLKEFFNEA